MSAALTLWLALAGALQAPTAPAVPAQPAVPALTSPTTTRPNVWLVIYNVVPEGIGEFEAVARQVRGAMQRSTDDLRRRQADGLHVYRSALPNPEGHIVYFLHVPELRGGDDDRTGFDVLIDAVLPAEATALKTRLQAALDPRNPSGNTLMLAIY